MEKNITSPVDVKPDLKSEIEKIRLQPLLKTNELFLFSRKPLIKTSNKNL
jgi:hypothetical protein